MTAVALAVVGLTTFCGRRPCGDAWYVASVSAAGVAVVAVVVAVMWLVWTRDTG